MKRTALLSLLLLALLTGCTGSPTLVTPIALGEGGGGVGVSSQPTLDIVIVMGAQSTGFNPENMMRVLVNGVERTSEVLLGGSFGVLPMDPAPAPGNPQLVELFRRVEPDRLDSFTWTTQAYTGPTIASVNSGRWMARLVWKSVVSTSTRLGSRFAPMKSSRSCCSAT